MDLSLALEYPFDIKDWNEVDSSTLTLPISEKVSQDFTKCNFKEELLKLTDFSWTIERWSEEGKEITVIMNKLVKILKENPELEGLRLLIATMSRYVDHYNVCKVEKHFIKPAFVELKEFLESKIEKIKKEESTREELIEELQKDEPIKEEVTRDETLKENPIIKEIVNSEIKTQPQIEKQKQETNPVREKINIIEEVNKISSKLLLAIVAILYIITSKSCCNQCCHGRN